MPQSRFENPAQRHDFLVHGVMRGRPDAHRLTLDEQVEFRKLVKACGGITSQQIDQLLEDQDWMEICKGNQA